MASQITSLMIVYSTVYSGADPRQHQSSASLAFVRGIHRWPVNSPHKWPVTRKLFPFDDVIMHCLSDNKVKRHLNPTKHVKSGTYIYFLVRTIYLQGVAHRNPITQKEGFASNEAILTYRTVDAVTILYMPKEVIANSYLVMSRLAITYFPSVQLLCEFRVK